MCTCVHVSVSVCVWAFLIMTNLHLTQQASQTARRGVSHSISALLTRRSSRCTTVQQERTDVAANKEKRKKKNTRAERVGVISVWGESAVNTWQITDSKQEVFPTGRVSGVPLWLVYLDNLYFRVALIFYSGSFVWFRCDEVYRKKKKVNMFIPTADWSHQVWFLG